MTAYKDRLALAERHVVEGEIRVTHQVILIVQLRAQGHDTAQAENLLVEFERALAGMYEHLHVLQAELDAP